MSKKNLFRWHRNATRRYCGNINDEHLCSLAHIMQWRDRAVIARNSQCSLEVFQLPQKMYNGRPLGVSDDVLVGKINNVIAEHIASMQSIEA